MHEAAELILWTAAMLGREDGGKDGWGQSVGPEKHPKTTVCDFCMYELVVQRCPGLHTLHLQTGNEAHREYLMNTRQSRDQAEKDFDAGREISAHICQRK